MDLPRNAFKAALAAGRRQIGLWCTIPDPAVIEMHAGAGLDWIVIDTEHTPLDAERVMPLLQAASAYPVSACVRPGANDSTEIKKLMDAGAQTVIVPYVQSGAEAEAAVAAMHYPPRGMRGVGGATRSSGFGRIPGYVSRAGAEICAIVQVETVAGLDALDDILAVPDLDGVFIGPADLSTSMGHPDDLTAPPVRAAILDATRRIRAAGKAPGILSHDRGMLADAEAAGALFLAVGVDLVLLREAVAAARTARG
ncbi:HpcH/HpaI aldolase family protein [Roseivivax isoporae]|uniref:Alpha-dehydro-beta-deoxy-D-glucarate aldolase n=1 Tax=Roseivivax isoporae LMG 25204 TaxID=1449351 RepID=X7FDM4_9RHOB|nr:HpcH/HpaI aldolase/citrate lyase family protein [Roseivivax isoporae]ETX30144.1 alpha-dehydro-beta-deoxy-D-glucarate aldolase [Roseivivax isoporae LMG 25204]